MQQHPQKQGAKPFYHTSHHQHLFLVPTLSLYHHPPSTSRSLEGKGKNHPSLSFPALSLPLHPAATMSGLYSQGFSPARTLSPQIRSNPDADRY
jgi:hypothetical protein